MRPPHRLVCLPLLLLACGDSGGNGTNAPSQATNPPGGLPGEQGTGPEGTPPEEGPQKPTKCVIDTSPSSGQWDPSFPQGMRELGVRFEARLVAFADNGAFIAGDEPDGQFTGFTNDLLVLGLDAAGKPRSSFGSSGVARFGASSGQGKAQAIWADSSSRPSFIAKPSGAGLAAVRLEASGKGVDATFATAGKADLAPAMPGCRFAGASGGAAVLSCTGEKKYGIVIDATGAVRVFENGKVNALAAIPDDDGSWLVVTQPEAYGSRVQIERWSRAAGAMPVVAGGAKIVAVEGIKGRVSAFFGDDERLHVVGSGTTEGKAFLEVSLSPSGTVDEVTKFELPLVEGSSVARLCDGRFVVLDNVYPSSLGAPHDLKITHFDATGRPVTTRGTNGTTHLSISGDIGYGLMNEIDSRTGAILFHRPTKNTQIWLGRTLP